MTQNELDLKFMKEAIAWAGDCQPIKPSIPKVAALIAFGDKLLGGGRRGTGKEGDDEHAEWHALEKIKDKSALAKATLYTTLEPCTPLVRSKPLECCTELILQHRIKRVFVGILDPNQGVTGKGLWRLQDNGVEVALFPHDLAGQIRAQNAEFIRSQQTLCATIVSPKEGEELRTFESEGKYGVRFEASNPPGSHTYLLIYKGGSYWPQEGPFRQVDRKTWEIDAHFGETGDFTLQLVTAGDLAEALIRYYRKVTAANRRRRENLRGKVDMSLLGGDYPGIEMSGLPKGFQLEASVRAVVAYRFQLLSCSVDPATTSPTKILKILYEIECSENVSRGIWLGASFRAKTGKVYFNTHEDKLVPIAKGQHTYERALTVAKDAPLGEHFLNVGVWRGPVGNSQDSRCIASNKIPFVLVE